MPSLVYRKAIKLIDLIFRFPDYRRIKKLLSKEKFRSLVRSNKNWPWRFPNTIFFTDCRITSILLILVHQFDFIDKYFFDEFLIQGVNNSVSLWSQKDIYSEILLSISSNIKEGFFDLSFSYCGDIIYVAGFSVIPGFIYGINSENVILISKMQVIKGKVDLIEKCLKEHVGINLQRNIFHAIIGIANKLKIYNILSVKASQQLSFKDNILSFYSTYNSFFETIQGVESLDGLWYIKLPLFDAEISNNSASHRRRRLIRRRFNGEIIQSINTSIDTIIDSSRIRNVS